MTGNYNESGVFHVCSECVPVCSRTWNVEKQYVPGVFQVCSYGFYHTEQVSQKSKALRVRSSCTATASLKKKETMAVWLLHAILAPSVLGAMTKRISQVPLGSPSRLTQTGTRSEWDFGIQGRGPWDLGRLSGRSGRVGVISACESHL